jgi:hypothetical protein
LFLHLRRQEEALPQWESPREKNAKQAGDDPTLSAGRCPRSAANHINYLGLIIATLQGFVLSKPASDQVSTSYAQPNNTPSMLGLEIRHSRRIGIADFIACISTCCLLQNIVYPDCAVPALLQLHPIIHQSAAL